MVKKLETRKVTVYVCYDSEEYEGCSPPQLVTTDKAKADRWVKQHYARECDEFEIEVAL